MLLWPEVCLFFFCMNEHLKCREMVLRNFLYSLEHCIAPRDQYILEVIVNNIIMWLTHSSIFVSNIQLKQHTFDHNNYHNCLCHEIRVTIFTCIATSIWHPQHLINRSRYTEHTIGFVVILLSGTTHWKPHCDRYVNVEYNDPGLHSGGHRYCILYTTQHTASTVI